MGPRVIRDMETDTHNQQQQGIQRSYRMFMPIGRRDGGMLVKEPTSSQHANNVYDRGKKRSRKIVQTLAIGGIGEGPFAAAQ